MNEYEKRMAAVCDYSYFCNSQPFAELRPWVRYTMHGLSLSLSLSLYGVAVNF